MRRFTAATVTTATVTAATALLATAALIAGAAPAQARTAHTPAGGRHGFSVRLLGGLHLKRVDTKTGQTHTTYLLCTSTRHGTAAPVIHGAGGLKDATSACEEVAGVKGRFAALSVHPTWLAPMLVAPVDVKVAGTWEGVKVAWNHEYPNGGALAKATGDLFEF